MSSRTFQLTIASASGPAWFSNLTPLTWLRVADGSGTTGTGGARFDDPTVQHDFVKYFQQPHDARFGTIGWAPASSPEEMFRSWNGGTMDTDQKRLLMIANGGHQNGFINAGFALNLNTATPHWERILDATPGEYVLGLQAYGSSNPGYYIDPETQAACYDDGIGSLTPLEPKITGSSPAAQVHGRPAAMHTAGVPMYAHGRVWFLHQPSYYVHGISNAAAVFSCDLSLLPSLKEHWARRPDGTVKVGGTPNGPEGRGPWRYHGVWSSGSITLFGFSFFNPVLNKVYLLAAGNYSSRSNSRAVDVTPGVSEASRKVGGFTPLVLAKPTVIACTYGLPTDYGVILEMDNTICVGPLASFETGVGWVRKSPSTGGVTWNGGATPFTWASRYVPGSADTVVSNLDLSTMFGLHYHQASRSFVVYDPALVGTHTKMRVLDMPSDPINGVWNWREVSVAITGTPPTRVYSGSSLTYRGNYNRFNILRDFSGGFDLLVLANYPGETYVMKLPNGDF